MNYNIFLDGLPSVGKTSFYMRITTNTFNKNYISTLPIQNETQIKFVNEHPIKYTLYDVAKNEAYWMRKKSRKENVIIMILMYDITNKESFEEIDKILLSMQMDEERKYKNAIVYVVGNKIDLENERKVDKEEVNRYFRKKKIKQFECSNIDGSNVFEIMNSLIRDIHNWAYNREIIKEKNKFILSENITNGNTYYNFCFII